MYSGCMVALVTPFRRGEIDEKAFQALVSRCLEAGVSGFVPGGTTGESATLEDAEQLRLIKLTKDVVGTRVPVIAGAGGNNTKKVVARVQAARTAGADAVLSVTPYYSKPSQDGLVAHFELVAREGGLPVVLYNIPGRTGVALSIETLQKLSRLNNIVAVKDATGNIGTASEVVERCGRIALLAGDDNMVLPMLAVGGKGVISASANVDPARFVKLCAAWEAGRVAEAQRIHHELAPLVRALFSEPNPSPAKAALSLMRPDFPNELRLPLVPMTKSGETNLRGVLATLGLL